MVTTCDMLFHLQCREFLSSPVTFEFYHNNVTSPSYVSHTTDILKMTGMLLQWSSEVTS